MQFLKLPAGLRWSWVNCLIILIMMTVYRIILVTIFSVGSTPKLYIITKGIANDAGVAALVGLVFMGLTLVPQLHPYRSTRGMHFSFLYFSSAAFMLAVVFALDLVFIKTFGQRIFGVKFLTLFSGNPRSRLFATTFPYIPFIVGTTLMLWLWWLLVKWLHTFLGVFERAEVKMVRFTWYGLSLVIFVLLIWNSFTSVKNLKPHDLRIGTAPTTALQVNPVVTLLAK